MSPLTQYWCNTFKKVETDVIARVENDDEEETEPIVIDGCSIMGGERDEHGNGDLEKHEKHDELKNVNIKRENHENIENLDANLIYHFILYVIR